MTATCALLASLHGCASTPRHVEVRHANGRLARTGELVDGRQQGHWTFCSEDGVVIAEGDYDHDKRDGLWTHRHENGALRMRGRYEQGRQVGTWEFGYPNGKRQCAGEYVDGREFGPWVFADESGNEQQLGCFLDGHRQLQWVSVNGGLRETGSYLDDRPVGRWKRTAADGSETVVEYQLPHGVEQVLAQWEGGGLRREGFVRDGKPSGLWCTRHPGGALRAIAAFDESGRASGPFRAYDEAGNPLLIAQLRDGRPVGVCTVRIDGAMRARDCVDAPVAPWNGQWSTAAGTTGGDAFAIAMQWLQELCSPPEIAPRSPTTGNPPAETTAAPEAPTDPGTWTEREREELAMLRRYYRDGTLPPNQKITEDYSDDPGAIRLGRGDTALARKLLGSPLPLTTFPTTTGKPFDLSSLRGHRVLLVVLRGFTSQVCVYCYAQTTELAPFVPRCAELDCEVVVLFPGKRSRLDAFVDACRDEFGDKPPPFHLVYDPDLSLAKALGLEGDLARPTSIVLDRDGIVRYAYVAESERNVADRPPATELIAAVARLAAVAGR